MLLRLKPAPSYSGKNIFLWFPRVCLIGDERILIWLRWITYHPKTGRTYLA